MLKLLSVILVVFLSAGKIQARCCIQKPINCYECDSTTDIRCKDPFNRSAVPEDHPPVAQCNGCCVKWVRKARTVNETIKRTCISHFNINLFMVDRACLQEKSKTGHLCFCEEEICNGSHKMRIYATWFLLLSITVFCIIYFMY